MKRRNRAKLPGFDDPYWEASRWVWVRFGGQTHAFAPDAYAEVASLVAALPEKAREPVPHALLVRFAAAELVDRGWMRFEAERTASGRRRLVIKLVPPEERPPPPAKRRSRRPRAAAVERAAT